MSDSGVNSAFLQILSLGFVWVFLHCSPMCGPIVSGLNLGKQIHPALGLFLYQTGRGFMYAVFGGLAGYFGSSMLISPWWGWLLVAFMATLLVSKIFPDIFNISESTPRFLVRTTSQIQKLAPMPRALLLGVIFSFLPCMLTLWALGLAAGTRSVVEGAGVMICLVAMTTLPLLSVSWGIHRLFRGVQRQVTIILLGISFVWTLMVTMAANELIAHQHWMFELGGKSYTLMFW